MACSTRPPCPARLPRPGQGISYLVVERSPRPFHQAGVGSSLTSLRFTNRRLHQFYQLVKIEGFVDEMDDTGLTKFLLLICSTQQCGHDNDWNLVINAHRHQLQFILSTQVRHHEIKKNEIRLMFEYSVIETQALCCHERFVAFICQCLCQQLSNGWIIIHDQDLLRHRTFSPFIVSVGAVLATARYL